MFGSKNNVKIPFLIASILNEYVQVYIHFYDYIAIATKFYYIFINCNNAHYDNSIFSKWTLNIETSVEPWIVCIDALYNDS